MYCQKCGKGIEENSSKEYYSYDYLEVETTSNQVLQFIDYYEVLGWEISQTNESFHTSRVILFFKRLRKISNKEELLRNQVQVDDILEGITKLEKSKTSKAMIYSLIIGVLGILILGGGMSLVMLVSSTIALVMGIVIGVLGIVVASRAYFIYRKVINKQNQLITPMVAKKHDELNSLLSEISRKSNLVANYGK